MIFDKYLSQKQKIIIAIISGCVWIYFRDNLCYIAIRKKHYICCLGTWIYLNYKDPLFLPIGLLGLYLVSYLFR